MKILFHGPGTSTYLPEIRLPNTSGVRHPVTDRLSGLQDTHSLTSNRGNLIHAEAPARIITCRPRQSAFANLGTMHRIFGDRLAEVLARNFDLIVISAANFISPKRDLARLRDSLNAIGDSVPFIVLGAGMQGQPKLSDLDPSVQEVLDIYNRRAKLFAVRGMETEAWLHANGFTSARALGCPSMYVFPRSIMSINADAARKNLARSNVLTAGYVTVEGGRNFPRGRRLVKAMRGIRASYVFQDEFFAYGSLIDEAGTYDEATSTADRQRLNALLTQSNGMPVDFMNYYYFSETAAWRQVASMHDVYIGDRFHGGVAALQVGRPGIFLSHDNRVAELTDFFALPRMSTDDLVEIGVERAIKDRLTPGAIADIHKTYPARRAAFNGALEALGLTLAAG